MENYKSDKENLKAALKKAYEAGWHGSLELADQTVEELLKSLLAMPMSTKKAKSDNLLVENEYYRPVVNNHNWVVQSTPATGTTNATPTVTVSNFAHNIDWQWIEGNSVFNDHSEGAF